MRYFTILLISAAVTVAACGSDNASDENAATATGSLSAVLDWGGTPTTNLQDESGSSWASIPEDVLNFRIALIGPNFVEQVTIGVAEGSHVFTSVPVNTGSELTVETLVSGAVVSCIVTVSNIAIIVGITITLNVDMSGCTLNQGAADVSWGEGELTVGGATATGTVPQDFTNYYTFEATAGTSYTITLTPSSGNPDLYLYSTPTLFLRGSSLNTGCWVL